MICNNLYNKEKVVKAANDIKTAVDSINNLNIYELRDSLILAIDIKLCELYKMKCYYESVR